MDRGLWTNGERVAAVYDGCDCGESRDLDSAAFVSIFTLLLVFCFDQTYCNVVVQVGGYDGVIVCIVGVGTDGSSTSGLIGEEGKLLPLP